MRVGNQSQSIDWLVSKMGMQLYLNNFKIYALCTLATEEGSRAFTEYKHLNFLMLPNYISCHNIFHVPKTIENKLYYI